MFSKTGGAFNYRNCPFLLFWFTFLLIQEISSPLNIMIQIKILGHTEMQVFGYVPVAFKKFQTHQLKPAEAKTSFQKDQPTPCKELSMLFPTHL